MSECLICGRWQDSEPRCECYEEMLSLRAKLQAAERDVCLLRENWSAEVHRAEAAEAEVEQMQKALDANWVTHQRVVSAESRAEAAERQIDLDTNVVCNMQERIDQLQAEVARLTQCLAQADRSDAYKRYRDEITMLQAEVNNLASLVRILVHSLRKVNPDSSNIIRAMDYLKRNGLTGSILRSDEQQPKEIPYSGGHLESADCWCEPTVEEHPGGTLIIHNRTH